MLNITCKEAPLRLESLLVVKFAICTYNLGYIVRHTDFFASLQEASDAWVGFQHSQVGLIYGFNSSDQYVRRYEILPRAK
mgnify:CR=1 FL=1